jgi:hypothetical protein
MKKLLFIFFIILSSCTNNSDSKKQEVNNLVPPIEVGRDYVANNEIAYVFRDLFYMSEASKALNANDEQGARLIMLDSDKTMLIPDSIILKVHEVTDVYCEVRITSGIYANEKGYVFNSQLKLKE